MYVIHRPSVKVELNSGASVWAMQRGVMMQEADWYGFPRKTATSAHVILFYLGIGHHGNCKAFQSNLAYPARQSLPRPGQEHLTTNILI